MPKNSSEYFYIARWTFPKAYKIFQGYLKIYPIYYEYNSKFKYNNGLNSVLKIFLKMFIIFGLVQNPCQNITNII